MVPWVVITVDDLADYLVGAQLAALRQAALAQGQTDPFTRIMQDRCNYIRNRISKRISISATPHAVPPELKTCACLLIIEAMSVRLSIAINLDEDQARMVRQAYRDLDIAATDEFPVSLPDDPIDPPVQQGGHGVIVKKPKRLASREQTKGL
jgi:hypothetical protein